MLQKFFSPKSVAVIGASHTPGKVGYVIAENFSSGYGGKVFFVNPDPTPIFDRPTYPSVSKVPDEVDLAVIAVPATLVPRVLKECVAKRIGAVVIVSAGFSEVGDDGKRLEDQLRAIIKGTKTRVIGPNVVGVFDPHTGLDTVFLPRARMNRPKAGKIAFISQSGAVGTTIMDWLAEEGVGVSKFVSYGNAMDVTEADLIEYLADDPQTKVIAAYIEGIKSHGKRFVTALKRASRKKPIIFLKSGKTEKGSHAAASHTGSLAGSARIYSTAFHQFGAIEAQDWEELFDFAKAFAMQPVPRGDRLLIVTNGGGFGVLATDEAERQKLHLNPLPDQTIQKLKKVMKGYASLHNPLDLTADSNAGMYELAFEDSAAKYDGAVMITLFQVPTLEESIVDRLTALQRHGKPILCCGAGGKFSREMAGRLEKMGIPVYPTPERAVRAFSALVKFAKRQRPS